MNDENTEKEENLNRLKVNLIFNEGMDDFLKSSKSVYDCPYSESTQNQRYLAWREGFFYAAGVLADKMASDFANTVLNKECIYPNKYMETIVEPKDTVIKEKDEEVIEIKEKENG